MIGSGVTVWNLSNPILESVMKCLSTGSIFKKERLNSTSSLKKIIWLEYYYEHIKVPPPGISSKICLVSPDAILNCWINFALIFHIISQIWNSLNVQWFVLEWCKILQNYTRQINIAVCSGQISIPATDSSRLSGVPRASA